MNSVKSIHIEDDLDQQDRMAIEVVLQMKDGPKRWCFVFNPVAMSACGDWINGTQTPFHYGAAHMIVIGSTLTEELIHKAIEDIDSQGRIVDCTLKVN